MLRTAHQLLTFFDSAQTVKGRKKLQKVIHLLKHANHSYPFNYQYHHYGPYSPTLQYEVNRLVQQNYINENNDGTAYQYTLTKEGSKFKDMLENEGNFRFSLNRKLLDTLLQEESQFLEVVSTYAFLIESGDTPNQAKEKTEELKAHLSHYLEEAINFYKEHFSN